MSADDLGTTMARAAGTFVETINRDSPGSLDYSLESVSRLDSLIDEAWPQGPSEDTLKYTLPLMAAYVGEVIRRNLGGTWVADVSQGDPVLKHGEQRVFPYNRSGKRLTQGRQWSLALFCEELQKVWLDDETPESRGWRPFKRRSAQRPAT
jgi:hypothetical protein